MGTPDALDTDYVPLTVSVTRAQKAAVQSEAQERQVSLAVVVRDALRDYWARKAVKLAEVPEPLSV